MAEAGVGNTTRTGDCERKTKETQLRVSVDLDGKGTFSGSVGVPFLEHRRGDIRAVHRLSWGDEYLAPGGAGCRADVPRLDGERILRAVGEAQRLVHAAIEARARHLQAR